MIEHKLPSNQAIRMANTNIAPAKQQSKKHQRVWQKYKPTVSLCQCISSLYLSFPHYLSRTGVSLRGVSFFLWNARFLATEMSLVLSHKRGTLSKITLKSLVVCTIQRILEQQLHTQPLWWIEQLKIIFEKTSKQ
jgi:hypothetical protein